MKLNRRDLTNIVADQTGLSKRQAEDFIVSVFNAITGEVLKGHTVSIHGFGSFDTPETKERVAHNPATLAKVNVPAGKRLRFKVSSTFRQALKAA